MVHKNHPGAPIHPGSAVSGQMSVSAVTLCAMESELPSTLRYLAGNQCGVISRSQALRAGLTTDMIKFRLRSGRWRLMHRGVYATFTGIPGRGARLWAAVLSSGPGATLSYQTAAELHGLVDKTTNPIHVTVPHARHVLAAKGVSRQVAACETAAEVASVLAAAPAVLAWLPSSGTFRIAPGRNRWTGFGDSTAGPPFRHAGQVAQRWNSPHWTARARAAADNVHRTDDKGQWPGDALTRGRAQLACPAAPRR